MLKPCPFFLINITSPGFEGWANLIQTASQIPIAMLSPGQTQDMKELIEAWNTRTADGVVEFLDALNIAQETGAEIKMTPLMWKAVEKIRATMGGK